MPVACTGKAKLQYILWTNGQYPHSCSSLKSLSDPCFSSQRPLPGTQMRPYTSISTTTSIPRRIYSHLSATMSSLQVYLTFLDGWLTFGVSYIETHLSIGHSTDKDASAQLVFRTYYTIRRLSPSEINFSGGRLQDPPNPSCFPPFPSPCGASIAIVNASIVCMITHNIILHKMFVILTNC